MNIIILTAVFAAALAFTLGTALGFFREFFAVAEDPLKGKIRDALPGANCGACGYPGCDGYAAALAEGQTGIGGCTVGGKETANKLSAILGISANVVPVVAVLACRGSREHTPNRGDYRGLLTCRGAKLASGSTKLCAWGCLGFGDCVAICRFEALSMDKDGLPRINRDKCTGCKLCMTECPQGLLQEAPRDRKGALALCSNRNPVKALVKKTCEAGCIKCGLCVKSCPKLCITIENGIPKIDYTLCVSCGVCVSKCPTKVLALLPTALLPTA
ncbi:MAG: RnfABCDGE type electron transport complex subunit B [Treponema sp.]|jgi:Na+-translocating ferredoxin:NAD+ oxidoreductase RNF subunit RnfB|nr:RnfABCDGE type electron transport complex subunit B [Treponema sp.]